MNRSDGYRLKDCDPFFEIIPHIMVERNDAANLFEQDIDFDALQKYINTCRNRGVNMKHMSIIVAAFIRTAAQNCQLNRFVVNKNIFARNHMCVSFTTLSQDKETETCSKVYFNLDDNVFEINDKINAAIEIAKEPVQENSMDKLLAKIMRTGLVRIVVKILKWWDKHFSLSFPIIDASPFHTTMFITNLASLRIGAVYHHIYNFGTTSVFIAMGTPEKKLVKKGMLVEEKRVIRMKMTVDERIASGYYFSKCFKEINNYLKNPTLLEERPQFVEHDKVRKKNPKWIVK